MKISFSSFHALVPHVLITGLITLVITDSTQSRGPIYFTGVFNNRSSRAHKYLYSAQKYQHKPKAPILIISTKSTQESNNSKYHGILPRNAGFHLKKKFNTRQRKLFLLFEAAIYDQRNFLNCLLPLLEQSSKWKPCQF